MRENSITLLVKEAKECIKNERYLAALLIVLILPDICGKVLYPRDIPSVRYKNWFDKYVVDYENQALFNNQLEEAQLPFMNGEVAYQLRCAMLHEGSDDIASRIKVNQFNLIYGRSARLESIEGSQRTDYFSDGTSKTHPKEVVWDVCVSYFCEKIIKATKTFLKNDIKESQHIPTILVQKEIPEIFKPRKLIRKNNVLTNELVENEK